MVDVDQIAAGLTAERVDAQRYGQYPTDLPQEVPAFLLAHVPAGSRVIDVGCGNGILSVMLRDEAGCDVRGIEPSPDRAAVARARGVAVDETLWDAAAVARLAAADVVTFMDVLEHLPEPYGAVQLAKQLLRPGGRVIASVPNVAHWTVRAAILRGKFDYAASGIMDATHLRWFTRATFRQMFDRAGLEVIAEEASAGILHPFYQRRPWITLGTRRRDGLVRRLTRRWPTLFGVQLFVAARRPDAPG